jgi:hypothetical protein
VRVSPWKALGCAWMAESSVVSSTIDKLNYKVGTSIVCTKSCSQLRCSDVRMFKCSDVQTLPDVQGFQYRDVLRVSELCVNLSKPVIMDD